MRRAIGGEIRRLRMARRLSQAELGVPLSRAYVSAVERGRVVPSLPALQLMASRLGVSLSALFRGIENGESGRDP